MKLVWIASSLAFFTLSLEAAAAPPAPPEDVTTSCTGKKLRDACTGAWDFVPTPKASAKKGAVGGGSWVKSKEPGVCGVAVVAKDGVPAILQCNSKAQLAALAGAKAATAAAQDAAAAAAQDAAAASTEAAAEDGGTSAPGVPTPLAAPPPSVVAATEQDEKASCSTAMAPAGSSGFAVLGLLGLVLAARRRA